ncbi:MAG TPA: cyd operon YbgE family protein [Burkholderiaceae bacterium]|jgi:predicted membrane protein|nr:cyd operon YbgE family protein [Burkholderiaceae bacterium]
MNARSAPGIALLPLLAGIAITLLLTVYPQIVVSGTGRVHHGAALSLAWAMSAGFVRGVGFVPQHRALQWLLSGTACGVALALSLLLLWWS